MQNIQRWSRVLGTGAMVAALAACAGYPQGGGYNQPSYPAVAQPTYPAAGYPSSGAYPQSYPVQVQQGRVVNIETVRMQDSGGVGAGGAIIGGVLGGLVGHNVGGGSGRTLATAAGVVGGALAGSAVQNHAGGGSVRDIYRVTVEARDGGLRSFDYPNPPQLNIGDRVRIEGDQLVR